jgi:hypothetical protein
MKRRPGLSPCVLGCFLIGLKPYANPKSNNWSFEKLSLGETLRHDGGVEAFAQFVRDLVDLFSLVNMDGLFGGVQDDAAVLATLGVGTDFFEKFGAELVVEVVREVSQKVGAVHAGWPSCFLRK